MADPCTVCIALIYDMTSFFLPWGWPNRIWPLSVVCHGRSPDLADLGDVVLCELRPLLGLLQLLLRLPELGQVDGRDLLGLLDLLLVRPE